MGRRRRTLLSSGKSRRESAPSAPDSPSPATPAPAQAPEEPKEASAALPSSPSPAPVEPVPEPTAPEPPVAAPITVPPMLDDHGPAEVFETPYVDAGTGMRNDTTDTGWDDERDRRPRSEGLPAPIPEDPSVYRPSPPPKPGSIPTTPPPAFDDPNPHNTTGTYYPGFGHVEEDEEAATVRFTSYDNDTRSTPYGIGDYDHDQPPPTEEVPSAVLQDVSQAYSAPMNVPEPPPIPGILDRFTPVGAPRRNRDHDPNRPAYLSDTPPGLSKTERRLERPESTEPERESGGSYLLLFSGILVFLLGSGAVLLVLFSLWATGGPTPPTTTAPVPVVVPERPAPRPDSLEGRGGVKVKVKQGLRADEPDPTPVPAPEPEPEPVPQPATRPAPTPRPPRPEPKPPVAVPSVQSLGTLSIRSNKKALVYVDGNAIGLTPKSIKADTGKRTISAMLPGQPQSKQTKTVTVTGGKSLPVNFTF